MEDMVATLRFAALRGVDVVQMPRMVVRRDLSDGSLIDVLSGWALGRESFTRYFPSRRVRFLPSERCWIS
jgi:DNA-binding transcriptional LysR family regulator